MRSAEISKTSANNIPTVSALGEGLPGMVDSVGGFVRELMCRAATTSR